jgi:type III secretion protein J
MCDVRCQSFRIIARVLTSHIAHRTSKHDQLLGAAPVTHRLYQTRSCTIVLLAALALLAGCEKHEELVVAPSQKQAMQVLVALADRGITDATQQQTMQDRKPVWVIRVPRAALLDAQRVLIEKDLPYEEHGGFDSMLSESGIIPSKTDERARLMHAIGQELARTFESYDNVTHARVHIMLPEKPIGRQRPGEQGPQASAMVLIKYVSDDAAAGTASDAASGGNSGGGAPSDAPIPQEQVRQMVAGSVEDLDPASVMVAYTRARRYAAPIATAMTTTATTAQSTTDPVTSDAAEPSAAAPAQGSSMLMQLLLATGAFALLSLVLLWMLVRSRRQANATNEQAGPQPTWTTDPSNRSVYDPSQASAAGSR